MIFLRNKKICNLCFRWHILRSYRFVVEVTFKEINFEQNLRIGFTKNDEIFKNKIFAGPCQSNQLSSSFERWAN